MDNQKVIRSAGIVGAFILLSRGFGLLRDMAMAALFGSSMAMDAFVVAFTIPNLFRGLFGEGALSSAFVPVFTAAREQQQREQVWDFAAKMGSALGLVLAGLTIVGILLTALAAAFFPLSPRIAMILALLRIMLPYMFFICLAAFFSAMLNALRRFALPAAVPVVLNLVMLAALLLICPRLDATGAARVTAVAWSVVLAGAVQWLMQLPPLLRLGFRPRFVPDWRDPNVRRVWSLMGAAAIGVGVTQINVLLDRFIAVFIGPGSPSYLYYAERLIYLPLGIFATALGTVLLPAFSGHAAQARTDRVLATFNHSTRQLLFVMLPAAAGMLALAEPIVGVVYERGGFSHHTAAMTTLALQCYAPGLVAFSLLKVLIPVFYAHQDMQTPVRVGIACTLMSVVLKLILMWPFKHAGIAIATVIAAAASVVTLGFHIHRRIGSPGWIEIFSAAARMLIATAMMAFAAVWIHQVLAAALPEGLPLELRKAAALLVSLAGAIVVYGVGARLCRCPELAELWDAIRRREAPTN